MQESDISDKIMLIRFNKNNQSFRMISNGTLQDTYNLIKLRKFQSKTCNFWRQSIDKGNDLLNQFSIKDTKAFIKKLKIENIENFYLSKNVRLRL